MENNRNHIEYKVLNRAPIKGDVIRNKREPDWIAIYDHHSPIRHKGLHTVVGGFVFLTTMGEEKMYMSSTTVNDWEVVEELKNNSDEFVKGDRIVCKANNLEGTFVMFDNNGYPILVDVSDNELPTGFRKEWWYKKVYNEIPYTYEEDTTKEYVKGKGQPAIKVYNTRNGRYPSLENSLLGLCPICHLFSTKCMCGYNYGFKNQVEFQNALLKLDTTPYVSKAGSKVFLKFDEEKFSSYIHKFSNEDKEKAFVMLLETIPATRRNELIKYFRDEKR